jgi:hypothetical protein
MKPEIPEIPENAEEAENAVDASSLEGTKGYNFISPSAKEITHGQLMSKNPPKWEHLIK